MGSFNSEAPSPWEGGRRLVTPYTLSPDNSAAESLVLFQNESDNDQLSSEPYNTIPERPMTPLLPPIPEMRPRLDDQNSTSQHSADDNNIAGIQLGSDDIALVPLTSRPDHLIQRLDVRQEPIASSRPTRPYVRNVMHSIPEEREAQEESDRRDTISNVLLRYGESAPTLRKSRSLDSIMTSMTDIYVQALSTKNDTDSHDTAVGANIHDMQEPRAGLERTTLFDRLPFGFHDLSRKELKQHPRSSRYIERGGPQAASGRRLSSTKAVIGVKDSLSRRFRESVQKLSPRRSVRILHSDSVDDLLPSRAGTTSTNQSITRSRNSCLRSERFAGDPQVSGAGSHGTSHRSDLKSVHKAESKYAEQDWETIYDSKQSLSVTPNQSAGIDLYTGYAGEKTVENPLFSVSSLSPRESLRLVKAGKDSASFFPTAQKQTQTRPESSTQAVKRQNTACVRTQTQKPTAALSSKFSPDTSDPRMTTSLSDTSYFQKDCLSQDIQDSPALSSSSLFPQTVITKTHQSNNSGSNSQDPPKMDKGKGRAREWDPTDPFSKVYHDPQPYEEDDGLPELRYEDLFEDIEDSWEEQNQRAAQSTHHQSPQDRHEDRLQLDLVDSVGGLNPDKDGDVSTILKITAKETSTTDRPVVVVEASHGSSGKEEEKDQHKAGKIAVLVGCVLFPLGGFLLLKNLYDDSGSAAEMMRLGGGSGSVNRPHEDERKLAGLMLGVMGVVWVLLVVTALVFAIWVFA